MDTRATETLAALPGFSTRIDARAPVLDFARALDGDPGLPGLLISENGRVVTMLSRRRFTDRMSRPFFFEVFRTRTLDRLIHLIGAPVLRLPGDTPIPEAVDIALARPRDQIYEPILLEDPDSHLIDIHMLILGQSDELRMRIRGHEAAVETARRAEERYRSLVDGSVEGIFATDAAGVVTSGNPALARILGYEDVEQMLASAPRLDAEFYADPQRRTQLLARLAKEDVVLGAESEIRTGNDRRGWVRENLRAIRDGSGHIVRIEGTMQDISERVRKERYRQAMEAAQAASQMQSEFLASISHEIRTPLHSILSFARFGIDRIGEADAAKLQQYFAQISSNGQSLLELVNDLLDLSKLEAGQMRLEIATVDLSQLLAGLVDEFLSVSAERGLHIGLECSPERLEIECDAHRLSQVVRNLLGNSLKFSPDHGEVRVHLVQADEYAVISIRDQGMGIPEDELELVFERFRQSSRTDPRTPGTGLGLAISREIVGAHGGEIVARNCQNGGAEFIVTLPRKNAQAPDRDSPRTDARSGADGVEHDDAETPEE